MNRRLRTALELLLAAALLTPSCSRPPSTAELVGRRPVAEGPNAKWSPDGRTIAFITHKESPFSPEMQVWFGGELAVVSVDGKSKARTITSGDYITDFVWSPDSREILAEVSYPAAGPFIEFQVIDVASGAARTIHEQPSRDSSPSISDFQWLKDGNIALQERPALGKPAEWKYVDRLGNPVGRVSSREKIVFETWPDSVRNWIMNADGSDRIPLVYRGHPDAEVLAPIWSDAAAKLAVLLRDSIGNGYSLYVTDIKGKSWQKLADSALSPQWSPDGRWLIFRRFRRPSRGEKVPDSDLYLISADGRRQALLLSTPGSSIEELVFAPAGDRVLSWGWGWQDSIAVCRLRTRG